ncbi:DHA2 family efflux MFS transporter permease subunit [Tunturiibacter gelidiferens]|uniref:DHA2 family efflux MFS transporter permease subunit n=1 Tax=Tunturiibacter gelidiferens TaxID=3069689 RepID=A0AAU7YVC5_9BACT
MAQENEISNPTRLPETKPLINPWIVAVTVTLATFMEVLDSSIANVALPHIAGTLGASSDESTWVITSYLVSSAIVLPMSGWLSNIIGRKRFYMMCVAMFTISSFLCALAPTLPMLILFRVLQGAGGGGLQPSEQAILADTFSAKQRGMAFALYGMAVVVAPAIGPTLGGWITDNYSWHWIFLINVPIGILSLVLTQRVVRDPEYLRNLKKSKLRVDYMGISLIVIGVGFLQYVLDKGQENDWFSSRVIFVSAMIAGVALVALVVREITHENPIMDLRLLNRRNFAAAAAFSFILGIVLNGSTILLPQFLQNDLGYTAQQAGMALSPGGIALAVMMPVAGILAMKFDPRAIIAIGFAITSFGLFHVTNIYLGVSFNTMIADRVIQVIGIPLIFIPISTLNYVGIPQEKFNQVSGISNFMRNLGGGIGVSLLGNFITQQGQIHRTGLTAHTNHANPFFESQLNAIAASFRAAGAGTAEASHKALAQLSAQVDLQSNALAFVNAFWLMGAVVLLLTPLPFLMCRPSPGEAKASAAMH